MVDMLVLWTVVLWVDKTVVLLVCHLVEWSVVQMVVMMAQYLVA